VPPRRERRSPRRRLYAVSPQNASPLRPQTAAAAPPPPHAPCPLSPSACRRERPMPIIAIGELRAAGEISAGRRPFSPQDAVHLDRPDRPRSDGHSPSRGDPRDPPRSQSRCATSPAQSAPSQKQSNLFKFQICCPNL
jgi:hypothetical protein